MSEESAGFLNLLLPRRGQKKEAGKVLLRIFRAVKPFGMNYKVHHYGIICQNS